MMFKPTKQPIRGLIILAVSLICRFASAEAPPIASSTELLGEPAEVEFGPLRHVIAEASCDGRLSVGDTELSRPDGRFTIRIAITNVCEEAASFDVRSAFIRSDGSVVPTPYPRAPSALEGMARGFVGLISLGASEVAMELESAEPTIVTRHTLEAGEALTVEHQFPHQSDDLVGVRAFVSSKTDSRDDEHAEEVRRTLDEQYWKARDAYFTERKQENQRWDKQRALLEAKKEDIPVLSEAYKNAMNHYWDEHRNHLSRLQSIEKNFDRFRNDHRTQLNRVVGEEPN